MSLRPKLRALDVLIREYQDPLTLHVQEANPLIVQRVHPLYHTVQAPAKVAGGCATPLYSAPDLTVTNHSAHPSRRALVPHFTVAGVTHCHANVYFPTDGDLDTLQEIPDWVYPYLLLTPAKVVVLTGDLNANCRWVPHLPVSPAPLCNLVLPTLTRLGLRRLHPLAEATTWVTPQGFVGALDHTFLRTPSEVAHTTEVRSDSNFPSDHVPVLTTLLVSAEMRDGRVHFLRDTVYLNRHPIRCATGQDYVRVLCRHALPHFFHPVNSRRLFSGTRSACRALLAPRLTAHYPLAMFVAKCHGTVNWFTSVRPPSYGAMRVLDAMAALALRASAGWALSASAHFLREIPEGGVGVPPAPVVGLANFLSVYIGHLNHPNPLVRRSTRHELLTALWRFHPSQPCLTSELRLRCAAHPTDHDLFVALCHQCDISIHLPPTEHLPSHAPHVMALSSPGLEVQDTHAWMIGGHRSAEDARRGGWPRVSSRPTPPIGTPPPPSWPLPRGDCGHSHVLLAPQKLWHPPQCVMVPTDPALWWGRGSILPRHSPIPGIPCHHTPTAGQRLHGGAVHGVGGPCRPGPLGRPAFGFRSSSWHFADCKGYIKAQEGRREPNDSLQGDLIRECRAMASGHAPPHHLYSHITGTWLDTLLDQVDAAAGQAAVNCPATVGWLSPMHDPRVCFSHAGLQVHDALPPHTARPARLPPSLCQDPPSSAPPCPR